MRIGGRIACLSALAQAEIFAIDKTFTHVHIERAASRTRHPNDRFQRLTSTARDGVEVHWSPLLDRHDGSEFSVGIPDALAQVLRCQHRWFAIASLDNALFTGAVSQEDLAAVFAHVPGHLRHLRARVDGRSEAGQESVLRMMFEEAGLHCDVQVEFPGIGRVDLLVEGCVVVEADSRLAHHGWELHVRDRNRDIDLARLGYMSLRPAYQRTISTPYDVLEAVLQLLAVNRHFRTQV